MTKIEFYEPLPYNVVKFCKLLNETQSKKSSENDGKENFQQSNTSSKGVTTFTIAVSILYLIFLIITWFWNITEIHQSKKLMGPRLYSIFVLLTVMGTITTIPFHLCSLFAIRVYKFKINPKNKNK